MSWRLEDRRELQRWLLSGALAIFFHAGIAGAVVLWAEPVNEDEPEGSVVIVDLAPEAAAPMEVPNDMPLPEQTEPQLQPQEVDKEKIEPAPAPDVAMLPPPESEPPQPKEDEPPPPPVMQAPPPMRVAPRPVAPQEGTPAGNSKAVPRWKTEIVRLLERNKRYPTEARSTRPQGVVQLAFSIDRQGRVISARIASSSGSTLLDNESLELVRRVQPFPPPPAELAGQEIQLAVPIRYSVR